MNEKETTKQRMIKVTRELICQGKKPSEITVADITERANVGNGMVNYHFQSKENLIREAVQEGINCANELMIEKLKPYANASSREKLIVILKEVMDFSSRNVEIYRMGIMKSVEEQGDNPHMLYKMEVFNKCINEICENNANEIWKKKYMIVSFFNYVFLKASLIKEENGFDFFQKEERDHMIEEYVSNYICNIKE